MKLSLVTLLLTVLVIFGTFPLAAQWVKPSSITPLSNEVTCLARRDTNLFAGFRGYGIGTFRTTDHGDSWVSASSGLNVMYRVNALFAHGSYLLAGLESSSKTGGGGMFVSTNNGDAWAESNTGLLIPLGSQYPEPASVYSIAANDITIFITTSGGVFASSDEGSTWNSIWMRDAHGIIVIDSLLLATYADTDSIFRSTDSGVTWTTVATGLNGHFLRCFRIMGNYLFAGGNGVFRSTDLGLSWVEADNGISSPDINSFSVYDSIVFASSFGGGVFRTFNKGQVWASINTGLSSLYVNALIHDSTYLYAATADDQVWRRPLSDLVSVMEDNSKDLPASYTLEQNYPNPFNPATTIKFRILHSCFVSLKIFDVLGREVATLVNEELKVGSYERAFDAIGLTSGMYLYRLKAGSFVQAKKCLLLK